MAYSGTVSQTVFNTRKVIDRAFGRCKIKPQDITPEMIERAKDNLYLLLSALPAEGSPLWCMEKVVLPLDESRSALVTPLGTVDIVNAFYRTLNYVTGTVVNGPTGLTTSFSSPVVVTTVGLSWSGAAIPVTLQCSSDGISWTTLATDSQSASAGQVTWFDVDGATAKSYWKVIPTDPTATLSLTSARLANQTTEIMMARLNRDQYQQLPNKTFSGRPLQYWFDRKVAQPVMRLWPVPDSASAANVAVIWRTRHVMDVGDLTQSLEVPQRWLDAIIAKLAAALAIDTPEVDASLTPMLQAIAVKSSLAIWDEERDRSPVLLQANIGVYTR